MVSVQFPLLAQKLVDNELQTFDLTEFISIIKDHIVYLHVGDKKYGSVRLHGYDMNQPIRIAFPDYSPPLVVIVLQVYMNPLEIDSVSKNLLSLEY